MATLVFDQEYRIARDTPSDINEHIEVLKNLADSVDHVTEMGTRTGVSTRAFLAADVTLRAYDLFLDEYVSKLFELAQKEGKDAKYIGANVLETEIDETDLLFIDTWHCYDQLYAELTNMHQRSRSISHFMIHKLMELEVKSSWVVWVVMVCCLQSYTT